MSGLRKLRTNFEKLAHCKNENNEDGFDNLLTKVCKDKPALWKIYFVLLNAVFSSLCAFVTQDIKLTVIYIAGVAIIDILVIISNYINLEKRINQILSFNAYIKYSFFVFFRHCRHFSGYFLMKLIFQRTYL